MRKYKQLKRGSVRPYENDDFKQVFDLFLKFQDKAKIGAYYNITKGQSEQMIALYLFEEFKRLIKKSEHVYVAIDEETKEIFGFGAFTEGIYATDSLDLQLVFKDPDYIFNKAIKYLLLLTFKKIKKNKKVYAILGARDKFEKYVEFVKRHFKVKVHNKDSLGRYFIEF